MPPKDLPQPSPSESGVSVKKLVSVTDQARGALDRPVGYSSAAQERVNARVFDLLKAEDLPTAEVVSPSNHQLMAMVDNTLSHLVEERGQSHQPVEDWEPEILSVKVGVQDPRNITLLDRENPMQAGLAASTFRDQEGRVTTVTLRYARDNNDDRVFTDTYGIDETGEIKGAPYVIDAQRYEGRRAFPEVNVLLDEVKTGNLTKALTDLANIPEGRRGQLFQAIYSILYYAESPDEMRYALQFLFQGAQQEIFSVDKLADVFAWHSSNRMRTKDDPRYNIFRRLPEYPQAIQLLKAHLIPQDENGSNVSRTVIQAIPWVVDQSTITDEEFQRLANLLPRWQQQVNDRSSTATDALLFIANTLAEELPYIAQTGTQLDIALKTLQAMQKGSRIYLSEAVELGIVNLTARKLLGSED